jgi:hypothetical protein
MNLRVSEARKSSRIAQPAVFGEMFNEKLNARRRADD